MQMDQHPDPDGASQETIAEVQPEEVLVISLGTGPQITPGMMSENEVRRRTLGWTGLWPDPAGLFLGSEARLD